MDTTDAKGAIKQLDEYLDASLKGYIGDYSIDDLFAYRDKVYDFCERTSFSDEAALRRLRQIEEDISYFQRFGRL